MSYEPLTGVDYVPLTVSITCALMNMLVCLRVWLLGVWPKRGLIMLLSKESGGSGRHWRVGELAAEGGSAGKGG
jgi:hypothetical protein